MIRILSNALLCLLGASNLFAQDSTLFINRNYISVSHSFSHFSKDLSPWNTTSLESNLIKDSWSFQTRATVANRFSQNGWFLEQEAYKKFDSKDYLYLTAGWSPSDIFQKFHGSGEYFNSFKSVWEHSVGLKYVQFSDSLFAVIGTTSISKYYGPFLTIVRANVGYQNSAALTTLNGNIQQRYYHSDNSYTAVNVGYGYNPNLILFGNNDGIVVTDNRTFVFGLKTFQQVSKRWFLNASATFEWFDFGTVERNQYSYALGLYYTW